jgi:hypothetical protein
LRAWRRPQTGTFGRAGRTRVARGSLPASCHFPSPESAACPCCSLISMMRPDRRTPGSGLMATECGSAMGIARLVPADIRHARQPTLPARCCGDVISRSIAQCKFGATRREVALRNSRLRPVMENAYDAGAGIPTLLHQVLACTGSGPERSERPGEDLDVRADRAQYGEYVKSLCRPAAHSSNSLVLQSVHKPATE